MPRQSQRGEKALETKLTLILEEDLHHRFKVACVSQKTTMADVLRECIKDYITKAEKTKKGVT